MAGISYHPCEVLGLGCAAVDETVFVPRYPAADAKVQVLSRERHCGGLTATALVAAARLGARCAFGGILGHDDDSRFVLRTLEAEGIDVRHAILRRDARPVRSIIIVDPQRQTRNIFFSADHVRGADPRAPSAAWIRSARVLLVDRFGIPGMIRAARIARAAGVAVVADLESFKLPRFDELLALCDHLIVSAEFARQYTGARKPAEAVRRLWIATRSVVVVTGGAAGCWYRDSAQPVVKHLAAFGVKAVDTTGCGDVFHGAYAGAWVRGLPLVERLRFAAAAAALKATRAGGQAGIPTRAQVVRFLRKQRTVD